MKIGMNMLLWSGDVTGERFDDVFAMLAGLGYDGVEIPIFALDPEPYEALGRRLDELGLERTALTARGPDANPISADSRVRAAGMRENLQALECAAAVGAEILCGPFVATPCVFTGAAPTDEERGWAVELLHGLAGAAQQAGITLAVESLNHFEHYLANTAAQTAELCRQVDQPACRMMYDTFHAHLEEKDAATAIADCADMLAYVHVSENDRSTPGQGQVVWDATFRALQDIGYDGWLTVEALGDGDPQLAAEMKIWRRAFESEQQVARDGLRFVQGRWSQHLAARRRVS